jgi:hypothetical protein
MGNSGVTENDHYYKIVACFICIVLLFSIIYASFVGVDFHHMLACMSLKKVQVIMNRTEQTIYLFSMEMVAVL